MPGQSGSNPLCLAHSGLGRSAIAITAAYFRFRERLAGDLGEEVPRLVCPDISEVRAEILHLNSVFAERADPWARFRRVKERAGRVVAPLAANPSRFQDENV